MIKVGFGKALVVFFGVSVFAFGIFAIIPEKDWEPRIKHLKKLSADTTFVTERTYPDSLALPVKSGRLGAFYSCLLHYRHDRRSSKPISRKGERVIFKLEDNTRLSISINSNEGFVVKLDMYDKNNSFYAGSDLYGINCNMELLNKPDSDMYCEDKVLGNEIRPVCTYRPQQPPSQDDAKG